MGASENGSEIAEKETTTAEDLYAITREWSQPPRAAPSQSVEAPAPSGDGSDNSKSRKPDTFGRLNAFTDEHMRCLSSSAQATWYALWRCENRHTGKATVLQEKLAERRGMHVRTIQRDLDELQKRGFVEVLYRGHTGVASSYRLHPVPLVVAGTRQTTT